MNTTLPYIKYIADMEHYNDVLSMALSTKHELWLGTSDLKDLYVRRGREVIPFSRSLINITKAKRRGSITTRQATGRDFYEGAPFISDTKKSTIEDAMSSSAF